MTSTPDMTGLRHHHARRRVLAGVAVAAAMLLVAAGCGDDDTTSASAGSGSGSGDQMTIAVTQPADGAQVSSPFDVKIDASVPLGKPDTGRHHVHLYYDGNTQEGEYDLVYGTTFSVDRLGPGEHTIEAVIANADHSLTDARDTITVTVGDASMGAGGSGTTTTGSDATDSGSGSDSGYGY